MAATPDSEALSNLLVQTQSSDPEKRRQSEFALQQAKTQNAALYLKLLAEELSTETRSETSRQLAGLLLKNELSIKNDGTSAWPELPEDLKAGIKASVLSALPATSEEVSRSAASLLSKLALFEIPAGTWPSLVPTLETLVKGTTGALRVAALRAIGYICEDLYLARVDPPVQQSAGLMLVIAHGLQQQDQSTKLESLKALYHALVFADEIMESDHERTFLLNCVHKALSDEILLIQAAGWECTLQIAELHYRHINTIFASLSQLSCSLIQNASAESSPAQNAVVLPALEFWSTICDEELAIDQGYSLNQSRQHIRQSAEFLIPVLLAAMAKQENDEDNSEWQLSMAAGQCLGLLAQLLRNEIMKPVLDFVSLHFGNPDWHFRDAAVCAYGQIMEGPSSKDLSPLVDKSFDSLCRGLEDPSVSVRDSTAWTLGRIAQYHTSCIIPQIVLENGQPTIIERLLPRLEDKPRVAVQICYTLEGICSNVVAHERKGMKIDPTSLARPSSCLDRYLASMGKGIMAATLRPDGSESNLRQEAYSALIALVANVGDEVQSVPVLRDILLQLCTTLESSFGSCSNPVAVQCQQYICNVLCVLVTRLGSVITEIGPKLIDMTLQLIKAQKEAEVGTSEEAVHTLAAIGRASKLKFDPYISTYLQLLQEGIEQKEDESYQIVCIDLVGDLARIAGPKLHPACDSVMTTMYKIVQDPLASPKLKPKIMMTIGDIAVNLGQKFEAYFSPFMNCLGHATRIKMTEGPTDVDEWVQYIRDLRDGVLSAYSGILYCLKDWDKLELLLEQISIIHHFMETIIGESLSSPSNIHGVLDLATDLLLAFPLQFGSLLRSSELFKKLLDSAEQSPDEEFKQRALMLMKAAK